MRKNNKQLIAVLTMISVELCSLAGYTMPVRAGMMTVELSDTSLMSEETFLGTATVWLKGKGSYGGVRKFTFAIKARNM
jgi:hypothetical protein